MLAIALLVGACAAGRDLWPVERLDRQSAVNTTIMAEPWVFARDAREIAVNARDYLHVGVVETNRAGQRAYWLGVVAWSTVDRTALPVPVPPVRPGRIRFAWEEATLELESVPAGREAMGASEPIFAGPQPVFEDAWYLLSESQLARLALAPPVSVSLMSENDRPVHYDAWRVEPGALTALMRATGFVPPNP